MIQCYKDVNSPSVHLQISQFLKNQVLFLEIKADFKAYIEKIDMQKQQRKFRKEKVIGQEGI